MSQAATIELRIWEILSDRPGGPNETDTTAADERFIASRALAAGVWLYRATPGVVEVLVASLASRTAAPAGGDDARRIREKAVTRRV